LQYSYNLHAKPYKIVLGFRFEYFKCNYFWAIFITFRRDCLSFDIKTDNQVTKSNLYLFYNMSYFKTNPNLPLPRCVRYFERSVLACGLRHPITVSVATRRTTFSKGVWGYLINRDFLIFCTMTWFTERLVCTCNPRSIYTTGVHCMVYTYTHLQYLRFGFYSIKHLFFILSLLLQF